jgi:adenylylsulfate kinase
MTELTQKEMRMISNYFRLPEGDEPRLAVWVIGKAAAGKTTAATLLCERLLRMGRRVELVDGEAVREIFDGGLGHSKADRLVALDRLIHVNRFLQARGIIPITATICGLHRFQERVRQYVGNVRFVVLDCPLYVVLERDPKGLYAKARRGEIKDVFGLDLDFEVPTEGALRVDSGRLYPSTIAARVLSYLEGEGLLSTDQNRKGSQANGS